MSSKWYKMSRNKWVIRVFVARGRSYENLILFLPSTRGRVPSLDTQKSVKKLNKSSYVDIDNIDPEFLMFIRQKEKSEENIITYNENNLIELIFFSHV